MYCKNLSLNLLSALLQRYSNYYFCQTVLFGYERKTDSRRNAENKLALYSVVPASQFMCAHVMNVLYSIVLDLQVMVSHRCMVTLRHNVTGWRSLSTYLLMNGMTLNRGVTQNQFAVVPKADFVKFCTYMYIHFTTQI